MVFTVLDATLGGPMSSPEEVETEVRDFSLLLKRREVSGMFNYC